MTNFLIFAGGLLVGAFLTLIVLAMLGMAVSAAEEDRFFGRDQ